MRHRRPVGDYSFAAPEQNQAVPGIALGRLTDLAVAGAGVESGGAAAEDTRVVSLLGTGETQEQEGTTEALPTMTVNAEKPLLWVYGHCRSPQIPCHCHSRLERRKGSPVSCLGLA